MNTTLKPVMPASSQNASSATPSKPIHPQGAPMSYGQPSGPITQNPFPNTNMAHNHPTSQQNHYSLNVPGGGSHFNMGAIPASNHPVVISQPTGGPAYNPPKNVSYSSGFQHGVGHAAQNQNTLPPVSQTLPPTTSSSPTAPQSAPATQNSSNSNSSPSKEASVEKEKPQPNGTTETEPVAADKKEKTEIQGNHVAPPSATAPPQTAQPQEIKPVSQTASPQSQSTEKPAPSVPSSEKKPVQETKPIPDSTPDVPEAAPPAPKVPEQVTPDPPASKPAVQAVPTAPTAAEATPAPASEPVESESIQNDTESPKDVPEKDPLAIDNPVETEEKVEQTKGVTIIQAEEPQEEGSRSSEEEEADSEEGSDSEKESKIPARKTKAVKQTEPKTPIQKSPSTGKTKRQRMRTQHYQSPLPEIEIITKITSTPNRNKNSDDKLIYFYKNEFLAVRNAEGGFYLCQAVQNVYKSSSKIKIRWLSQDKSDKSGEIYTPDFYDLTDFDCILTSLDLKRVSKGRYRLKPAEKLRTDSILKRCLAVEKGEITQPSVSEEHPDGLDLSLYKDEEQLMKKKGTKRKGRPRSQSPKKETPTKKSPEAPKVRKVESKPTRNSSPAKKSVSKKPAAPAAESKKATPTNSKAARGKRKAETKTNQVVDQKKAKVLAKIGRKAGVPASSSKPLTSKSAKVSKATPSTSKVTKAAPSSSSKPPPRKVKRAARKY